MHRFYVPPDDIRNGEAVIKGEEMIHLSRVLRLGAGDPVIIFDGKGVEYRGEIMAVEKDGVRLKVSPAGFMLKESPLDLRLVQGIPKGDKMELVIQKATELGVKEIIPLASARCVVKLEGKKKQTRNERWQKVAVEAAKQCGRTVVPTVHAVVDSAGLISSLPASRLLLIPWEEGGKPLPVVLREKESMKNGPIYLVIGPEGGLEREEAEYFSLYGGITVTLGPRILRTETAGLAAAAVLSCQWGDMSG